MATAVEEDELQEETFAAREDVATVGGNMHSYRRITAGKDVVPAGLDDSDAG